MSHWSQKSPFWDHMSSWTEVSLTVNLRSYTRLAAPAAAGYVSPWLTVALEGQATSKLCPGIFKTLSREEEKEETALTKMSQKERRSLRSPFGNYKFGLPNKRSCFSEWNLYYLWLIWTTYWYGLFLQAFHNATGNDIYTKNYLLSPSWAISSSSASVFAAAIAWGNFRVNGRTSLLLKREKNYGFHSNIHSSKGIWFWQWHFTNQKPPCQH